MIHDSILGTIGNTPVVRINRLAPAGRTIYVKCEAFNPLGSVKDRLAIALIEDAERRGILKPGQTVVEATSGNTGIAPRDGLRCEGVPVRRDDGRLVLGRAAEADEGARREGGSQPGREPRIRDGREGRGAREEERLVPAGPVREPRQPRVPPEHHRARDPARLRREAPRLLRHRHRNGRDAHRRRRDPEGGPARRQGRRSPSPPAHRWCRRASGRRTRSRAGRRTSSRGCSTGRSTTRPSSSSDIEARDAARELAKKEGIFCGISSGGTFAAALKVAEKAPEGSVLLAMLPDTGERYLSTILFEGISEESDPLPD